MSVSKLINMSHGCNYLLDAVTIEASQRVRHILRNDELMEVSEKTHQQDRYDMNL